MYADGGHLYVFLVYGMHHCANVVTRREGVAEAVLLRAAEGPPGSPTRLLAGPGKLCAALGITVRDSGLDLVGDGSVRIFVPQRRSRVRIGVSPRIGIDYAGEAKDWPLRFYDADLRRYPIGRGAIVPDRKEGGGSRRGSEARRAGSGRGRAATARAAAGAPQAQIRSGARSDGSVGQ